MGERQADIETVLADLPQVHWGAPKGVWQTDRSCYEFIAGVLPAEGARTLETGCGVSTVLFALWAQEHVSIVPWPREAEACREYFQERGIPDRVSFEVGPSDDVLPRLNLPPLDLVLIDGGHAFPLPIVDWYYAASRLKEGGVVVLDDLQLPQVRLGLLEFLDADPRWERVAAVEKWAAYRRLSEGPLREEWRDQAFLDDAVTA
jgi:predicted O-methyltransferase YrrM